MMCDVCCVPRCTGRSCLPRTGTVSCCWCCLAGTVGSRDGGNTSQLGWNCSNLARDCWNCSLGVLHSKNPIQRESARLNGTLPDTVIFDQNGVRFELPAGAKAYHPWQSFDHWREGERVILLDKQDGTFIMLSVVPFLHLNVSWFANSYAATSGPGWRRLVSW